MAADTNQVTQPASPGTSGAKPKRKRRIWPIVLAGLAAVIVLAVSIGFWATSGLVDTIDRQLAAIKRGDMQAAYAENAIALRDRVSIAEFEAFVKRYPALHRNADRSFNSRSFQGASGEVKGTLTDDRGAVMPVQYRLVKESGAWRILSIRLGDQTD